MSCTINPYNNPGITEFKEYFVRDFPYGSDIATSITDADISKALQDADAYVAPDFFCSQTTYDVGFLNLAAHFLVMSISASSQGVFGQATWLQNAHAVGNVSESFTIPQRILDNPEFSWLTKTNYGMKYLMLIFPQLTGQMFISLGRTLP